MHDFAYGLDDWHVDHGFYDIFDEVHYFDYGGYDPWVSDGGYG